MAPLGLFPVPVCCGLRPFFWYAFGALSVLRHRPVSVRLCRPTSVCLSATPSPWSPFGLVSLWSCVPPVDSMSSATCHTHINPNINDFAAHTPIRWRTSNPLQNPSRNPPFILTSTAPTVASSATFWCPNGGSEFETLTNSIDYLRHLKRIELVFAVLR